MWARSLFTLSSARIRSFPPSAAANGRDTVSHAPRIHSNYRFRLRKANDFIYRCESRFYPSVDSTPIFPIPLQGLFHSPRCRCPLLDNSLIVTLINVFVSQFCSVPKRGRGQLLSGSCAII